MVSVSCKIQNHLFNEQVRSCYSIAQNPRISHPSQSKIQIFYLGCWGLTLTSLLLPLWTELPHWPFHSLAPALLVSLDLWGEMQHTPASGRLSCFFPLIPWYTTHFLTLCSYVPQSERLSQTTACDLAPSTRTLDLLLSFTCFLFPCPPSLSVWHVINIFVSLSPLIRMKVPGGQGRCQFCSLWNSQHLG